MVQNLKQEQQKINLTTVKEISLVDEAVPQLKVWMEMIGAY